jgi:hypothetical protein
VPLLTQTERDYLLQRREIGKPQQRYIRYKLHKKIKQFYEIELPLLMEKGYIVAASSHAAAISSHVQEKKGASLVRIPTCIKEGNNERERNKHNNGGPDVIRTRDPRHVKAVS